MECVEALVDDFSVDDLLDLSNADDIVRQETPTEEDEQVPDKQNTFSDQSAHLSSGEDLLSVPGAELDFPVDDLAELEWLSNFVEDSFSEPYLSGGLPVKPNSFSGNGARHAAVSVASAEKPFFRTPVPAKARSKRRRTSGRVWSLEPPSGNDTSASSSSSSSSLCPASKQAAAKNKGRKRKSVSGGGGGGAQQQRRCSHCGVQKTPQWRMGPLGAKTLCNACGVRFKSGRLLPEYRPACSPTFSSDIHSNSHRKVMELRRMKEVSAVRVEPGLTGPCA